VLLADGFGTTGAELAVLSPYTGAEIARVSEASRELVPRAVESALRHLPPPPADERASILERAARLVDARSEAFARTIALEAGKPIRQARGEVARCVDTLTFSAVEARTLGGELVPMESSAAGRGKLGLVTHEPVGVIAAIAPFNFPLNLVAHKVAPAVAAGCPVVLKPAEQTPLSALALGGVLLEAGLPGGFLTILPGPGETVGAALVDEPDIAMISFTGSGPVGWSIRARAVRKTVALELGNSTPVIVADDADVAWAADRIAASAFTHAGQSCVSVQRVYVDRRVHDDLLAELLPRVEALVTGDPLEEATDVGPVIDSDAKARIATWIHEALDGGAERLAGGESEDGLIRPTVLSGIAPSMRVSCEEVFGPVVGVAAARDAQEAIELANGTPYGLQAGIFTRRVDRALVWARHLRFGGVIVNETPTFRADLMPYGGMKASGNTREGPAYAVRSMAQPRLTVIDLSA
jgi:acyl-CoA reductase-like NAD-dependent aldehyde dehydrogenase